MFVTKKRVNVKYDSLRAFEKHLEGGSAQFSPTYLILSKEPFEMEEAVQALLRSLLPSHEKREFALTILDASQLEEKELFSNLNTRSFFAELRVIWIQQAEKLKKSIQDELIKYFARPAPSLHLMMSASAWAKNTNFYKAVEKEGIILELAEIKPWEKEKRLAEWVNKKAAGERIVMSYQVCQTLVRQIGADQGLIAQELTKLFCYCAGKKEISVQDVKAICTSQHADTVWQLGEALFRRDAPSAMHAAHSLLTEGQALLPLLRQIRSQFQTEFHICIMLSQGKQPHEITQEFPYMKGQILERHIQQARNYGLEGFKRGLLALDAAEMRAKNSSIDDQIIIELLVMQLINPNNPSV